MSFKAENLIKMLLMKDPKLRLGSKRGIQEIKDHPFFSEIDWTKLRSK